MAISMRMRGIEKMLRDFSAAGGIPQKFEKKLIVAMNNASFRARSETAEYLKRTIHNPTAFTLRPPYVHKARKDRMIARVESLDAQDSYLRNLEMGGVKERVSIPLGGSADKHGNLRKKFTRSEIEKTLQQTMSVQRSPNRVRSIRGDKQRREDLKKALGKREVPVYFIGTNGRGMTQGLWRRMAGNKSIRLLYVFKRSQKYKEGTLKLRDFWTREAEAVIDEEFKKTWFS